MDGRFASEVVLAVVPPAVMVQGVDLTSAAAAGRRNVISREFMATAEAGLTAICLIRLKLRRCVVSISNAVTIESDARISVLTVAMDEHSDDEYGDLRAVIAAAGAGPNRPMWLRWVARGGSASGPHGFVVVGACNYPAQTGQRPGSAAEQQLRREFDTCPR